jgi:hypothetical protein
VKRHQRLEGVDHFLTPERPKQDDESTYADDGSRPPLSAIREDDIEVYLRIVTYNERCTMNTQKFIQHAKWVPMSHRFEVYSDSIEYFQEIRNNSIKRQKDHCAAIEKKGTELVEAKKLGDVGMKELQQIISAKHVLKQEKKISNPRDHYMSKAKYNYELPPLVYWNEVELKL